MKMVLTQVILVMLIASQVHASNDSIEDSVIGNSALTLDNNIITTTDQKIENLTKQIKVLQQKGEKKNPSYESWLLFIAAIIIAIGAYLGTNQQTRGNTISGFRVKWIEDLRMSYSEFNVALKNVGHKIRAGELDPIKVTKDQDVDNMRLLQTRIKLMLNHSGTDIEHVQFYEKFLIYIDKNKTFYSRKRGITELEKEINDLRFEIEDLLLTIFKSEWEKAKKFK
ncbi:MAG: hypothetical protein IIA45_11215 [Bacteroidetes bacterium]|nr:hypothetical protein [Bacteroidota bacterium]